MAKEVEKIVEAMKMLGTYKEQYRPTIERLAAMRAQYAKDAKVRNALLKSNPELLTDFHKPVVISEMETLRRDIIAHERELGLTPSALKSIGVDLGGDKRSALADALADLGGGG